MQLVIKLDLNDVLDVLRTSTQHNIKNFVKNMDYIQFEEIIEALILNEHVMVDLIQDIKDGVIKIYDHDELDELDERFMNFYLLNNGQILGIDYSI